MSDNRHFVLPKKLSRPNEAEISAGQIDRLECAVQWKWKLYFQYEVEL